MFPKLIDFGPLVIHTYGFFVAAGFLAGLWIAVRQGKKAGLSANIILDLGFYVLLAALIGSRLFFIFLNMPYYLQHPGDIFKIWQGGLVFYGGVLLAVPTALWYVKKHRIDLWTTADVFAPGIALGHVFGRVGCFSAGCCYGKASEYLPWGVIFTDPECLAPLQLRVHPVQLYEAAGELVNFTVLMLLSRRKNFDGQVFMAYLLIYSLLRFATEFFRGDVERGFITWGISLSQGISIALFLSALTGFFILKKKKQTTR
jgi:phosphatidylglycerol---prolipoprotein diacylglyceryl transferase